MDVSLPETAPVREIELSGNYPGIRFEPGKHITSTDQYSQVLAQLALGNLNASLWNPEVAMRISQYSPVILAIDGQSPFSDTAHPVAYSPDYKKLLWTSMPARPQRLNTAGQIYTISADVTAYDNYLKPLANTNTLGGEQLSRRYEEVLRQIETTARTKGGLGIIAGPLITGILIAGATAAAGAAASELNNARKRIRPKISRRQFLHLTGVTTLGLLISLAQAGTAMASNLESSMATTEKGRQFWLDIIDMVRPRFIKSEWLNARTALLIAKSQDAIDFLGLPKNTPGSVVMGISHSYEASALMEGTTERKSVISDWATNLINSLDDLLEREGLMHLRQPAGNTLLNYITATEIFNINDPQGADLNPNFPKMIDYYVAPAGRFYSPRVEAAIHHLRI